MVQRIRVRGVKVGVVSNVAFDIRPILRLVGDHEEVDRGGEGLGIRTVILPMTAPGGQHGLARILELL